MQVYTGDTGGVTMEAQTLLEEFGKRGIFLERAISIKYTREYNFFSFISSGNVSYTTSDGLNEVILHIYNNSVEDITNIRARYFRRTSISGYIKIVRNDINKVVWAVENFTHVLEKVSAYRSVPWDDAMLAAYGERYFERIPRFRDFPSISRALYRFYDKILSRW